MTQLVHITEDSSGDLVIIGLSGEIDATNVTWIGGRVRAALSNQHAGLVIDISLVTYLDSGGIALLFALAAELAQRRLSLAVVIDPLSPVSSMLMISGLDEAVAIHATREAALAPAP